MTKTTTGVIWGLLFIVTEALQYVYFGGVFQKVSTFTFGFIVFGITSLALIVHAITTRPREIKAALGQPHALVWANIMVAGAVLAYLASIQFIEPAVSYTIGAGCMPVTAWILWRFGIAAGDAPHSGLEKAGTLIVVFAVLWLSVITVAGESGFVRGGPLAAVAGIAFAVIDGVLFTWLIVYCQRLSTAGVGSAAVLGLRFPLYVVLAGALAASGIDETPQIPRGELILIVIAGIALVVPPLYALHRSIANVSTMTISALVALGPFVVFSLQIVEHRVELSTVTLVGLFIYFTGAMITAYGVMRASSNAP